MKTATVKELDTDASALGVNKQARAGSIESFVAEIKELMGDEWPPRIYSGRVLTMRTRSHDVPPAPKGALVEVQYTLLGIELKVGRRRISCPDLATARYLSVFARAGLSSVAVPYDITKISHLADELESAWQRMLLLVDHAARERSATFRSRARTAITVEARREIKEAGAGAAIPQFNQNTRQRPQRI